MHDDPRLRYNAQLRQLASDERLAEAALPAFTIILIAFVPVLMLARGIARHTR